MIGNFSSTTDEEKAWCKYFGRKAVEKKYGEKLKGS